MDLAIKGYRTNADGTETRAWSVREDGRAICIHNSDAVCAGCVEADERIARVQGN